MDESEEDEEEVEMTVLGDGGEDVSIVPVVYPCGQLVSHRLVLFHMLALLLKLILNLLILICLYLS